MKEELTGFGDEMGEAKSSIVVLYTFFFLSIEGKVYEPPLITCLNLMNEKCGSDLILTDMIISEFREYNVSAILMYNFILF